MKIKISKASESLSNDKRLIVLDINGLLCHRYYINDDNDLFKIKKMLDLNNVNYFTIGKILCVIRPHVQRFLNFCYNIADVGFFSSMTSKNGIALLSQILTAEQYKSTKFMWFRDKTTPDPQPIKEYSTVKYLSTIFESSEINADKLYNYKNTLIIDDSMEKLRFNPSNNIVKVDSYEPLRIYDTNIEMDNLITPKDKKLYNLYTIIIKKFYKLA
jgi:hypothetical protein